MRSRIMVVAAVAVFFAQAPQVFANDACQVGVTQIAAGSLLRIPLAMPYGGSVMRLCDNGQLGEPMYSDEDYEFPGDDPWAVTVIPLAGERLVVAGR